MAVGLLFFTVAVRSARLRRREVSLRVLVQLAIFFFVALALTRLGPVWTFIKAPWQAMILEAVCALVFIFATRSMTDSGLTFRISARAWRAGIVVTGLLLLFVGLRRTLLLFVGLRRTAIKFAGIGLFENEPIVLEFLLYQLTMPGVAEELSHRAVIQPGLNKGLGRPWELWGAQVGWGWVITALVFWAPHAFRIDSQMRLSFYWPTLTMQLVAGFIFGWLRERTGSVLPPMIAHSLANVVWTLV
jgi:membrane protease YdiL (CAAX protease family)